MNPTLKIRTPEGITFSFPLAGPVVRCLAWSIDLVVTLLLLRAIAAMVSVFGLLSPDVMGAFMLIGYFLVSVCYGILLEWFWRGRTVGKWLLRLRVMDSHGLRLQVHQVLLRNLLRFVDSLPAFYLVGGVSSFFNPRGQRLGDIAASTVVIYNSKPKEPDLDQLLAGKFNSLRQHPHLEARLRQRVSAAEARLALQALVRRDDLEPAARVILFSELAEHFKGVVTFPPESVEAMPDEQYVRNVVDILFRTRGSEKNPPAAPTLAELQSAR